MKDCQKKYNMRIVRGAFINQNKLEHFKPKIIERVEDSNWISIEKLITDLNGIKELQKNMVRHYENENVPWYMDGYGVENKYDIVVAFGADDGESGRIFQFPSNDRQAIDDVVKYGISKGIPKEQMNFMNKDF